MGRLIDADRIIYHEIDEIGGEYEPYIGCSKSQIDNLPTVEAIPKADYETRLKADLVAILVELQLEIEELPVHIVSNKGLIIHMEIAPSAEDASILIQEKINSLKENTNADTNN